MSVLDKKVVLVLNRNWQAVNVATPAVAFCQMSTDVATGLDVDGVDSMVPVSWERWLELPVREDDFSVGTAGGRVRVPTVMVLGRFSRVPMVRPKFSFRNLWVRDGGRCQYTGRPLGAGEGNMDHMVPRSRGGSTGWENCVLADRRVNTRKADRTPTEAGLKLLKVPVVPRTLPVTATLKNEHRIPEWELFLSGMSPG